LIGAVTATAVEEAHPAATILNHPGMAQKRPTLAVIEEATGRASAATAPGWCPGSL